MSVWLKTKGKENQWTLFYDSCTLYIQVIKKSKQIQRVFTATHNIHLLNKRLNNKQPLSNSDAQTGKFVEQLQDEPKYGLPLRWSCTYGFQKEDQRFSID